ncbi:MAG: hypothetical protein R3F13_03215 [Prosthecobacter sp.]
MKTLPILSVIFSVFAGQLGQVSAIEVQSHGLMFERWLCDTFFDGYRAPSHTQKWDIPAEANPHHGRIPVNPKAAKYGTAIGLGDAVRQFEIDEVFLLITGFWEQPNPQTKRWTNVQAVRVAPDLWKKLWEPVTRADLEKLESVIKNKSLSIEEARKEALEIKSRPPFTLAVIQVNPKIDKSQRRLQCSLRFDDFFRHLAPEVSPDPQIKPRVFGVPVPVSFESAPRTQGAP